MFFQSNSFKKAIANGDAQFGLWLSTTSPYVAEIAATAGYDWLLIDGEHAPNTIKDIHAQLQAIAPYYGHPVVRPLESSEALVKQVLDIGAQTLLLPMIDTAEEAERMVKAMRYPPAGVRGVGASVARASRWGRTDAYMGRAEQELCLLVQAETATALENLEEIVRVDGVDGVFIGPADLSASLGHPDDAGHPEVQAAIEKSIKCIRKAGKAAGTLAVDPAMARKCLNWGANFVAVAVDTMLYARALDERLALFRDGTQKTLLKKAVSY